MSPQKYTHMLDTVKQFLPDMFLQQDSVLVFDDSTMMLSSKVDLVPFRHSVLDTESSDFRYFWIPAFAGMTVLGLLTSSSTMPPVISLDRPNYFP